MDKKEEFTQMKRLKKFALPLSALSMLFLLTGCVQRNADGTPTGLLWNVLGQPMERMIQWFAQYVGYGWAIILITLIFRTLIFPLGVSQAKKMLIQQEKMAFMKPILEPIQEKLANATSPEEKMKAQAEMQKAYKDNNVSMMGGIGCLPMLIQMPIFSALFFATSYTQGLADQTFLGMNLGSPSIPLVVVVAILYFGQGFVSMIGVAPEQRKQMQTMSMMSPIMMVVFTFSSPAGVGLYWAVGGIFAIAQTVVTNIIMKPRIKEQIQAEMKANPLKMPAMPKKDVTNSVSKSVATSSKKANRNTNNNRTGRNAGKQKR